MMKALLAAALALGTTAAAPETVIRRGNPILADGRYYSTDPAPIVVGDTLYILAGRDEAADGVNDFVMKEWQLLATQDPASGRWRHYPGLLRPETLFAWAEAGRAYAGQIVRGPDGRFYLYAPVLERVSDAEDRFAIGVAVADDPRGPWRDAHPAGPIISQRVPVPNRIQNIDPTVLVEGRTVTIIWGTFGQLRGMALAPDMVTPAGPEVALTGLTGFFEAPWLFARRGTYYLIYAANNAGPDSACTPTLYHACQAYGTAPSPLGPWTYRGVVLPPVSSTTSHAGAVAFKGRWYLTYHTADAKGGGHFRRSVAIDPMRWDDSVTPAAILPVVPTRAPGPPPRPTRNIAGAARAVASNQPVPTQYWINALNDGRVRAAPLPPDLWGTWEGDKTPAHAWIEYRWPRAVTIDGSRLRFFADHPAGATEGVAPPRAWHLEYFAGGAWRRLAERRRATVGGFVTVATAPVVTRCLRAVFDSYADARGTAAVAVEEWEVLAPRPAVPAPRSDAPVTPCA